MIGTYKVNDDQVCVTTAYNGWCFELFESDQGDFVRIGLTDIKPERIFVAPEMPSISKYRPDAARPLSTHNEQ